MPTYVLMGDYPMKRGGRHVQPGKTVKMSEEEAEQYVKSGRLKADEAKSQPTATELPAGAAVEPAAAPPPDPKPVSGPGKSGKTNKKA